MNILHLASFNGNIGDNASHLGLRNILGSIFKEKFVMDRLEIRRFYKNYSLPDKSFFNSDFTDLVNKYDLLLIGGGGFLDFWVENSVTGTTLDINEDVLNQIKIPIVISSVGCIPHKNVPEGNVEKFRTFLDILLSRDNIFLAVRNDGSKQVLHEQIGQKYFDQIPEVLDHGFFYENDGRLYRPCEEDYIIFNSTTDQLEMLNRNIGQVNKTEYLRQMQKFIDYLIGNTDLKLVFAPHIYSDYEAIASLLQGVNDYLLRTKISITPYAQGDYGCNHIFSAYKNSLVSVGMRFHANVCSIAMGVPSIGIAALDRITNMYEGLGLFGNTVTVDQTFAEHLIARFEDFKKNQPVVNTKVLESRKIDTIKLYQKAFDRLGLPVCIEL